MAFVKNSHLALVIILSTLHLMCVGANVDCVTSVDCLPTRTRDLLSFYGSECKDGKCHCKNGNDSSGACRPMNGCDGDDECTAEHSVCDESTCACKKGLPVYNVHTGKLAMCDQTGFKECSSDADCPVDRICSEGVCGCRYGIVRAKSSLSSYCKTINSCTSDVDCPYVDGYCDLERQECTCKEGFPLSNEVGYIYRCGPEWVGILLPIILTLLLMFICFIIILLLFLRWARKE